MCEHRNLKGVHHETLQVKLNTMQHSMKSLRESAGKQDEASSAASGAGIPNMSINESNYSSDDSEEVIETD